MTIHARSDVAAVTISPAHGGCGDLHSRPVRDGAPVKLWSLDCPSCEDVLRKDSHWSPTISGIPETPDELEYRTDQETKGRLDQQNQTAEALAKLASLGDLPAAIAKLADMFSGNEPKRDHNVKHCSACNTDNSGNARFCAECGLNLAVQPIATVEPPQSNLDLDSLTEDQLRLLAEERGLKPHHRAGKAALVKLLK